MNNPHIVNNVIKLRVVLPCSKESVWRLIATPEGLASWFPPSCRGVIAKDEIIEFAWMNDSAYTFRVLELENGHFMEMEWIKGAKVRYSIDRENPVVVTIEATYPQTSEGKEQQLIEIAPWAFEITNLKSIAVGGVDLRSHDSKFSWRDGFID